LAGSFSQLAERNDNKEIVEGWILIIIWNEELYYVMEALI